jgi:O-succinylbenzoic acid--CoA ligase
LVNIGTDENQQLWIESPMSGNKRIQTHDLIKLINEDSFVWFGRSDFTINSGGLKIQPELIENAISELIKDKLGDIRFFVGGIPDEKFGEKVVLFLETKEIQAQQAKLLLDIVPDLVPKYHAPKEVIVIGKFKETKSGKLNRLASIKSL